MSMTYYRYSLINATSGTLILTEAPQEWASDQSFWERSMTYWGIFRSFSTKELSFIRSGATYLKTVFEREGTEAVCDYKVEVLNTSNYTYSTIYQGLIDFSTYRYTPGSYSSFDVVRVQIIDNDFINKVKTRESLPVSLSKLVDLDGDAITPFTYEGKSIKVPQRTDTYYAQLSGELYASLTDVVGMSLSFLSREDEAVINVVDGATDPAALDAAFFSAPYATTLNVHLVLTGSITGSGATDIWFKRYDQAGSLQESQNVLSATYPPDYTVNIDDDYTFTCAAGDYVVLEANYSTTVNIDIQALINTDNTKIVFPDSYFKGWFYHEAFTRILQSITGEASPFYSEILGRTDSEIHTYASDGAMSLGVVTNGLLLRGFDVTDQDVSLTASLKDLFLSLHSIYPLSLGVESISGVTKIRIENLKRAFNDTVFLTVEGATEISEEVASDLTFSSASLGFSKADEAYNKIKGRFEYNTTVKYSTPLTRQQNEFSQIAPYRGDTNGMVGCLIKPKADYSSEDTSYDDENFVVNIVRDSVLQIARKEGFDTVTGADNPDHSYNLNYHPARNLMRWGAFLRGSVFHYTDKVLSFLKSIYNSGVATKKTADTITVTEGSDIDISHLGVEFFENIYYNFNFIVNNATIDLLSGVSDGIPNIYKLVRFRNSRSDPFRYGWLMRLESRKPDNKGVGSMKLLKARLAITITTTITGTFTIILTGVGVVVIDWGDGTPPESYTLNGTPQTITHDYTDGAAEHTISIVDGQNINTIDLTNQEVTDVTIPPVLLYDETDNPDGNITEIILDDNNIPDVDPDATWPDNVIIDYHGTPISTCELNIGPQVWMCRDWFVNYPGSKVYDDDESNRAIYGGMYSYEMIKSADFCPAGWHVPTMAEWEQLIEYAGGINAAGGKLKQTGTTVWDSPNTGATNDYDFKARGNGYYNGSAYGYNKIRSLLWCADDLTGLGRYVSMFYDSASMLKATLPSNYFIGVRLIKNAPYVETILDYDGNTYHVAYIGTQKWLIENLHVKHYNDGTAITEVTSNDDWKNAVAPATYNDWFLPCHPELMAMYTNLHLHSVGGFSNAKYWCAFDALSTSGHAIDFTDGVEWTAPKSTTFRVRAMRRFTTTDIYALRDTGPAGGLICHIINLGGGNYQYYEASPSDLSSGKLWSNISTGVSSSGGNIGDGPLVTAAIIAQAGHTDSAAKLCDDYSLAVGTDGAYCYYNNDSAQEATYGLLYNFFAVDNVKGLAPAGCRIATNEDYATLLAYLGSNAGGKLKEIGTAHWIYPNTGALDQFKFAARGAGSRSGLSGTFSGLLQISNLWTGTEYDTNNAYRATLSYLNDVLLQDVTEGKKYGFSVRCIVE